MSNPIYVEYLGEYYDVLFKKRTAYSLVGIEPEGYRVYDLGTDDAFIYSPSTFRIIPEHKLVNYKLDSQPITYRYLYENEFQDFRTDMTDEDYRRCFIEGEVFSPDIV